MVSRIQHVRGPPSSGGAWCAGRWTRDSHCPVGTSVPSRRGRTTTGVMIQEQDAAPPARTSRCDSGWPLSQHRSTAAPQHRSTVSRACSSGGRAPPSPSPRPRRATGVGPTVEGYRFTSRRSQVRALPGPPPFAPRLVAARSFLTSHLARSTRSWACSSADRAPASPAFARIARRSDAGRWTRLIDQDREVAGSSPARSTPTAPLRGASPISPSHRRVRAVAARRRET